MFQVKLHGFDNLGNWLNNFPQGVKDEILTDAGKVAGNALRDEIEEKAAHAFNAWTGRAHKRTSIAVNVKAQGNDEVLITVGYKKRFFYTYFLEYGTQFMEARPFFRPAFDAAKNKIFTVFRNAVIKVGNKRRAKHFGYRKSFRKY